MRRPEACTVSLAVVEVNADAVSLSYWPEAPDVSATIPRQLSLKRVETG